MAEGDVVRSAHAGEKLTYADFLNLPDDGLRHELINGEHFVTPVPNLRHQAISGTLFGLIWTYLQHEPRGRIYTAPCDVVLSDFDIVEPDLLYMSNERYAEIVSDLRVKGTPELIIEIGSPSTRKRDNTIKRRLYECAAVTEYWIVDPHAECVHAHRHDGTRFVPPTELTGARDEVLTTSFFPGLELPLRRIFRD